MSHRYRRILILGFALALIWTGQAFGSTLNRPTVQVVDINPDPGIFEAELSAVANPAIIDGQYVETLVYRDENNTTGAYDLEPDFTPQEGIPIPQIVVDVGDEVWIKFNNRLTPDCSAIKCNSSIHWHGIELDNNSDGTGVTQNHVKPGESYTYRFIAPRSGIFWFHPHMMPGAQTFAGMYGAFIVRDPAESDLQAAGLIPEEDSTHTLVLSDIEFDRPAGEVGYLVDDVLRPWEELKEECAEPDHHPEACRAMQDGEYPLVNGLYTGNRPNAPVILADQGEGVRLRLINTSTNRYFRLSLEGVGSDRNIYRIGGEGGFLERVRLEGGVLGNWDTKFDRGEIVIPASGRADVVFVAGTSDGTIMTMLGKGYERGGPASSGSNFEKPVGDLFYIGFTGNSRAPFQIAEGDPLLGDNAIENLKTLDAADLDTLLEPPEKADGSGQQPGTTNDTIRLQVLDPGVMAINGTVGEFEDSGDDYRQVPYQGATRYAQTGALLELTVSSDNNIGVAGSGGQHHPFHLHGFSFQPVKVIDNTSGDVLYEYDYNEFQDVIDVFGGQSLVFRTRLDDRPIITDTRQEPEAPQPNVWYPGGGAQGRWVYHCHLFLHAALGMISELVVVPTPVAVCRDVTVDTDPGICSASEVSIDDGSFHLNDENFTLEQTPATGPFPLGDSAASLRAIGEDGLSSSCDAIVTVVDNELPTITAPSSVVDECDVPGGSSVVDLGSPTTDDNCGQNLTTNFAPSFYPLGNTAVKWQTSDGNGNSETANQLVTVVDTKKPSLTAPQDVGPVECTGSDGEIIDIGTATATDVCDTDPTISNDAPASFGIGDTTVQWTAEDDSGNRASGIQVVTVSDTGGPTIECNAPEKIVPSDVTEIVTTSASDTCDPDVVPEAVAYDCFAYTKNGRRQDRTKTCEIVLNGPAVEIVDSGGVGGMVEWTLEATDASGNTSTKLCSVEVVRPNQL
jgi:FtsP/CotA-like multicopper oxidase with cupredoxin domain